MSLLCFKCYEIYDKRMVDRFLDATYTKNGEERDYKHCPKTNCIGMVAEVDELFIPIIIELNRKGYSTKYCCSGHYYDQSFDSYIYFEDDDLWYKVFDDDLPEGYLFERRNLISREFDKGMGHIELHKCIVNNALSVLRWAESLEKRKQFVPIFKNKKKGRRW